jgi:hypothetical protein
MIIAQKIALLHTKSVCDYSGVLYGVSSRL